MEGTNRTRMDELQAEVQGTRGFERLLDAIYECVDEYVGDISADTGLEHAFVSIAIRELVGLCDRYTDTEIAEEVEDFAEE